MDKQLLAAKVGKLCRKHRFPIRMLKNGIIVSAVNYQYLGEIEFFMHELAHTMGLGRSLDRVPSKLYKWVEKSINLIEEESVSDLLEYDASVVTFLAGKRLGLWGDDEECNIQNSCFKNLVGNDTRINKNNIWNKRIKNRTNRRHSKELAEYIREVYKN